MRLAMFDKKALATENTDKPGLFYGYVIVLTAFLLTAVSGGTIYSFGVFFKPILVEFGWTRSMISGAVTTYWILHGILFVYAGQLNDRFGPRPLVTVCSLILGLGYVFMSQINNLWQLYLFYGVFLAIGMSGFMIPLISTVARWFVRRRGIMTGIALSGIGLGILGVPPLASHLITAYGWRTAYIIIGVAALLISLIAAQFLRRTPAQKGQLPYGQTMMSEKELNIESGGISFLEAIRGSQFWMLCAFFSLCYFWVQATLVHIVPHATDLDISVTVAASILSVIGVLSAVGRVAMGSVADRIGGISALIICSILIIAAFSWLLVAKEVWTLYLFAVVFGFAYGGQAPMASLIVADLFGLKAHGIIFGAINFIGAIGAAIGPLLVGYIFDKTGSYQSAFLLFIVLSVIAVAMTILLKLTASTD